MVQRTTINELGENKARGMADFAKDQLRSLLVHLRVPEFIRDDDSRRIFIGVEAMVNYLLYNRLGVIKIQMSFY